MILILFSRVRKGVSAMAGCTGHHQNGIVDPGLLDVKKLTVNLQRHLHHGAGGFLHWIFIANIIQFMGVFVFRMTKIAGCPDAIGKIINHYPG